ncbi:MAG: hypothetical protein HFJ29_03685 [Clostridia bacterium]|nr:hypothetical protein [Clostridia bacterium]
MEKPKYYDMITKQEINEQELRQNIPYIILTDKWKIRVVTYRQDGKTEESFLTLQEEEIARREILRQRLMQMGYQVQGIHQKENFIVDGIQINVPNYVAQLQDSQGRKGEALYDCGSLEGLVKNTEHGKMIQIEGKTISSGSLIENIGMPTNINRATNARNTGNIILNIDQWGAFKATYNLRNPEDVKRLMEDQKRMPRNKEEAMRMKQGETQDRNFEE